MHNLLFQIHIFADLLVVPAVDSKTCSLCAKVFTRPSKRKAHEIEIHGIARCMKKKQVKCPITCDTCSVTCKTLNELRTHKAEDHGIENVPVHHEFATETGILLMF